MQHAPDIYGTSFLLGADKDEEGHLDIAILSLAYTEDGKVIDAAIYDHTWDGFKEIR